MTDTVTRALAAMAHAELVMDSTRDRLAELKAENEQLQLCLIWLMHRHKYNQLPCPVSEIRNLKTSGHFARIEHHEDVEKYVVFVEQATTKYEEFKSELELMGKPTTLPES